MRSRIGVAAQATIEESFELTPMPRADAENAVRRGQRAGFIALKPGFGAASQRMFGGPPKEIEIGGAMVPQFIMPAWMQTIGLISPIRWAMLAIEGGVWRQFTLSEMALPCAILISVCVACFAAGTRGLREG